MKTLRTWGLLALACLTMATTSPVYAGDSVQTALISRPSTGDLNVYAPLQNQDFVAADIPGGSAVRLTVPPPADGSNIWDSDVGAVVTSDLRKGDTVTAVFWARAPEGAGLISARLQGNDAPYTSLGQQDVSLDGQWRLHTIRGEASGEFAAGRAGLALNVNTRQQVVEIGPIYIFRNLAGNAAPEAIKALPVGGRIDAVITASDGVKLAASLRKPAGKGPFPAVTQFTGSGPWGRNPFDPVANALLGQGVAVLQFDKRGVGQSGGKLETATEAQLIDDGAAVAAWLKGQPGIDTHRTGVVGGSQGGLIAMAVAAKDPQVAFVISLAGPAQAASDRFIRQIEVNMQAQGVPSETIQAVVAMTRESLAALAGATSDEDAAARVRTALTPYIGKLLSPADAEAMVKEARNPVARADLAYDPKVHLEKVRVPVLALFGSLDLQVPAQDNAEALRRGLAGNPDVTVVILQGFNHLFQRAKTGTAEEWSTLKEVGGSDPEFLKIITDWIAIRAFAPGANK